MNPEIAIELHVLVQIAVAIVLGGLIGWERESAGKWAGLRTHMLLAAAATLFVKLGFFLVSDAQKAFPGDALRSDPIRLLEALLTGIAFLGAGTIFRDRSARMRGLTTAASLMITGAIGVAVAVDRYLIAAGTTLLALLVLRGLACVELRQSRQKPTTD